MMELEEGSIEVISVIVFFSYLRVHFIARGRPVADPTAVKLELTVGRDRMVLKSSVNQSHDFVEIIVESMVNRPISLERCVLTITDGPNVYCLALDKLSRLASRRNPAPLNARFRGLISDAIAAEPHRTPLLLDIGGRARSGVERRHEYPECDVTVVDIHPDPSVDIVCDAHELGSTFIGEIFDFALCVSVFEHILMPWKVALEINKVLKLGAYCLLHTHQTIGMHDLPWDFWRFSDTSWHGLFNAQTGFEVVQASMAQFMHVVPHAWSDYYEVAERSGGFEGSTVIVRKTGRSMLRWDVPMNTVFSSAYPLHADNNKHRRE